jgi:hypothetical protein
MWLGALFALVSRRFSGMMDGMKSAFHLTMDTSGGQVGNLPHWLWDLYFYYEAFLVA